VGFAAGCALLFGRVDGFEQYHLDHRFTDDHGDGRFYDVLCPAAIAASFLPGARRRGALSMTRSQGAHAPPMSRWDTLILALNPFIEAEWPVDDVVWRRRTASNPNTAGGWRQGHQSRPLVETSRRTGVLPAIFLFVGFCPLRSFPFRPRGFFLNSPITWFAKSGLHEQEFHPHRWRA
jgi:hypothetical protein